MKIRKIFYNFVIIFLLLTGLLLLGSAFPFTHYKFLIVKSGSMAPTIRQGSVIMEIAAKEYRKGDIIVFFYAPDKSRLITHRIYAIENIEGRQVYITKGDANEGADLRSVSRSEILGKVVMHIP
jgi:signal peptidase